MTDRGPRDEQPIRSREAAPSPGRRRAADPWSLAIGALGAVLLGAGATLAILGAVGVFKAPTAPTTPPPPTVTAPPPAEPPPTLSEEVTVAEVARRVIPSTVYVEASSLFRGGSGSGVVYGGDGYILTNHHVIDGASQVHVTFSDGAQFPAQVVGSYHVTDLAVLLTARSDVAPIDLGESDGLAIGQPAVAVGNPLGDLGGPTVTAGIVSALNRSLDGPPGGALYGLVQTDAPISPGSSGGALVDAKARLIGITTAIALSEIGPEGIGFAIPIDLAVGVAADLIKTGEVAHARLGVSGATIWATERGAEYPVGIHVRSTSAESSYEGSGGRVNDVIVEFAGVEVATNDELLATLRRHRAGDVVEVRILREDHERVLDVELGSLG